MNCKTKDHEGSWGPLGKLVFDIIPYPGKCIDTSRSENVYVSLQG